MIDMIWIYYLFKISHFSIIGYFGVWGFFSVINIFNHDLCAYGAFSVF